MSEPTRRSHKAELDFDTKRRRVVRALSDLRVRLKAVEDTLTTSGVLTNAEEEQRLKALGEEYTELTRALSDWRRTKIRALTSINIPASSEPVPPEG